MKYVLTRVRRSTEFSYGRRFKLLYDEMRTPSKRILCTHTKVYECKGRYKAKNIGARRVVECVILQLKREKKNCNAPFSVYEIKYFFEGNFPFRFIFN